MSDERETIQRNPESVAAWKRECAFLREQVEKLTKERDDLRSRRCEVCGYLEHEREHTGCLREQLAALAEQNEKLTEAYDQCGRTVQDYGRTIDQTESRLREVATHCANVEQQLAALAEQNEKFRETLSRWRYQNLSYNWCCGNCGAVDGDEHKEGCALSLPNLATPALNRIRAEGMRMAAEIVENTDVYTFVHGGRSYDDGGITLSAAATAIRAKADELEQSNG